MKINKKVVSWTLIILGSIVIAIGVMVNVNSSNKGSNSVAAINIDI